MLVYIAVGKGLAQKERLLQSSTCVRWWIPAGRSVGLKRSIASTFCIVFTIRHNKTRVDEGKQGLNSFSRSKSLLRNEPWWGGGRRACYHAAM